MKLKWKPELQEIYDEMEDLQDDLLDIVGDEETDLELSIEDALGNTSMLVEDYNNGEIDKQELLEDLESEIHGLKEELETDERNKKRSGYSVQL